VNREDTRFALCVSQFGTSAFYSRQLCLCPFPAYSVFSPATSFPLMKWSETCTTTLILLISVSFETIWGGGCNMHFYLAVYPVSHANFVSIFRKVPFHSFAFRRLLTTEIYLSVKLGFIVCLLHFMHICHARVTLHYSTLRNMHYCKRRIAGIVSNISQLKSQKNRSAWKKHRCVDVCRCVFYMDRPRTHLSHLTFHPQLCKKIQQY